jgi:hypothetical protein
VRKLWTTFRKQLKRKGISCRRTNRAFLSNMRQSAYAGKISSRAKTTLASARRTKILSDYRQKKNPALAPGS